MYTYFVQGQEIRHILMHLIQPGQARFSYRDQDYFWDSVAIGLVDIVQWIQSEQVVFINGSRILVKHCRKKPVFYSYELRIAIFLHSHTHNIRFTTINCTIQLTNLKIYFLN